MTVEQPISRYSPEFDVAVRGDTITADRYITKEWMELEKKHLWPKVWHLGGVTAELERQFNINEDIIRFITIRVDELEAGPSVQMRKNDRERTRRREREEA